MTRPTVLSLFSGIGGLDLGLERAGWQIVGQVENDPYCQRVLAKHWPKVPRWGDIREVNPDDLPRADLVAGGFPCQPFSTAGRRRGINDERWLWPEFAHVVRHLRPRFVLVENVPGLLARHGGMGVVLGDLAACGYDAEWDCIPAAAVGAPHQRDRVWVVAYPQLRGRDGLHERQQPGHLATDAPGSRADGTRGTAAEDHRRGVPRPGPQGSDVPDPECQQLREQPGRRDGQGRPGTAIAGDDGPARPVADANGELHRHGHDGTPTIFAWRAGPDAGVRPALQDADQWRAEPDVGRVAHGVPARLDRLRGLGNAVVPQVAELIGRRILAAHLGAAA